MKRVAVMLANGHEEIEALTPVDVIRRAGAECVTFAVTEDVVVTGSHGVRIIADAPISLFNPSEFDAIVLPGGMPGAKILGETKAVIDAVNTLDALGKLVCAICASPAVVLGVTAYVSGTPATVWVSSLDENPIESSSRMLLVHLTDVQGAGTKYENYDRKMLLQWGKGSLVEKGSAEVSIELTNPKSYTVYELDTSGIRVRKLKSTVYGNKLTFTVSTENPMGTGRIYYEIVKK